MSAAALMVATYTLSAADAAAPAAAAGANFDAVTTEVVIEPGYLVPGLYNASDEIGVTLTVTGLPQERDVAEIVVLVDDLIADSALLAPDAGSEIYLSVSGRQLPGQRFPGGVQTLTFRVYDDLDALVDEAYAQVEIDPGPTITWKAPHSRGVVEGGLLLTSAAFEAYPGSQLEDVDFWIEGGPGARRWSTCRLGFELPCVATNMHAEWRAAEPGLAKSAMLATSNTNANSRIDGTVEIYPAETLTMASPEWPSVTCGEEMVIRGAATHPNHGGPLGGASVVLQRRVQVGEWIEGPWRPWQAVASKTTSEEGRVRFRVAACRSLDWRLVLAGEPGQLHRAAAREKWIGVRARVRVIRPDTTVKRHVPSAFHFASAPYEPGVRLLVQSRPRGGDWVTRAQPTVRDDGTATAKITFTGRGTRYLRVIRPWASLRVTESAPDRWRIDII